ncbi:MAG: HAMP domain-containing protein [Caldilineae bacterium]|nr:MAG: HAMP domain-containing protein [Caldilineae bacterium]
MSLGTKIFLGMGLVILVAMSVAGLLIGQATSAAYRGYLSAMQQERLAQLAAEVGDVYAQTGSWEEAQAWLDRNAAFFLPPGWSGGMGRGMGRGGRGAGPQQMTAFLLVDPDSGAPLAGSAPDMEDLAAAPGVPVTVDGTVVARLALPGVVSTLGPAEQELLDRTRWAIVLSAAAAGAAALIVGALLVRSILRPLRRLEEGVARVAAGDLSARVLVAGGDEIARLAQRFNGMAASLEEQEALRRRLVADIAHELRTPLSVIQGNLQAILDGVYPLERAEIESVYQDTQLLARLVNDLHELGQAEAGRLPLSRQPLAVQEVLDQVQRRFAAAAGRQDIRLLVQPAPPGLTVDADPDRLQQILYNLIGNGLRHTPPGGRVQVRAEPDAQNRAMVRFSVCDSGPGIPTEDMPHIFDRFYRVERDRARAEDASIDRLTSGAGLGLAIVKALVELHGGAVQVENGQGGGACFSFTLPLAICIP